MSDDGDQDLVVYARLHRNLAAVPGLYDQLVGLAFQLTDAVEATPPAGLYLHLGALASLGEHPKLVTGILHMYTRDKFGLHVTYGRARNPMLARLTAAAAIPSGTVRHLPAADVDDFLSVLAPAALPAVSHDTAQQLRRLGIHSAGQLATAPVELVRPALGHDTALAQEQARGIDRHQLHPTTRPLCVGRDLTTGRAGLDKVWRRLTAR